jgi:putative transcriptional regulator
MFEDLQQGLAEVDAFLGGDKEGFKVTLPAEIDVKNIRKGLHMTQASFSDTFGFSLDAVKHWEGGHRTPEASARAFLTVIARAPQAVISALQPGRVPPNLGAGIPDIGLLQRGKRPSRQRTLSLPNYGEQKERQAPIPSGEGLDEGTERGRALLLKLLPVVRTK